MTSHPDTSPPARPLTEERGPIEILCKEIGFHFDQRMERPELLVAFVAQLVGHVGEMRRMAEDIAAVAGADRCPSRDSATVLRDVGQLLAVKDYGGMTLGCETTHGLIHALTPEEKGPYDHLIDMLSSCVSAIRFGLEKPCHSRHAAEAASHVWQHKYGVSLFDRFTPAWQREWTRPATGRHRLNRIPPRR